MYRRDGFFGKPQHRTDHRTNRPTEWLEVQFLWLWLWASTILGMAMLLGLWYGVIVGVSAIWENGREVAIASSFIAASIAVLGWLASEYIVTSATGAERLSDDHPLTKMVVGVARKAWMRTPRVYLLPDRSANAFATGFKIPFLIGRGAVGLTQGIVDIMTPQELEGIIGHELTHLKSGDLIASSMAGALIMTVCGILEIVVNWPRLLGGVRIGDSSGGSYSSSSSSSSSRSSSDSDSAGGIGSAIVAAFYYAAKVFLIILAIIAAILVIAFIAQFLMPFIHLWVNRQRERWADAGSAVILGTPDPLITALDKLENGVPTFVNGAGQFTGMFFNVPAYKMTGSMEEWMSTHPTTTCRIESLKRRADGEFNFW